ncbi:hypothetical protein [Bacillus sp. 03113]|nr:hypothetical protein [Bacillus sp. 03113]
MTLRFTVIISVSDIDMMVIITGYLVDAFDLNIDGLRIILTDLL